MPSRSETASEGQGGSAQVTSSRSKNGGRKRDDRRRDILKAAVKVFAERGYHGCRISDVAEAAGVAYGLVYHYFGNKDGLLRHIFLHHWSVFSAAMQSISDEEPRAKAKIERYIDWILASYEQTPEVIKVLLLEFGRTSRLGDALEDPELRGVFEVFEATFAQAKREGDLNEGIDPATLSFIFFGAVESALVKLVRPGGEAPRSVDELKHQLAKTKATLQGLFLATARAREAG